MLSFTDMAVTGDEAAAYASARGKSAPSATSLRIGQDYIASEYNGRWAVEFNDGNAPQEVKNAIIEAAIREEVVPGSLSPDVKLADQKTLVRLDVMAWQPAKANMSAEDYKTRVMSIEALLSPFLRSQNTKWLTRA